MLKNLRDKIFKLVFKHKIISAIAVFAFIGAGYFIYQELNKDSSQVQYAIATIEKGTLIVSISGSGQVSASEQVDIKPKVSGEVVNVYKPQASEVKKGGLLAVIDSEDAKRAVNDAEISLESAKIDLEELITGPDSQSLLQAQNALAQAERDLEKAKQEYENIETDDEKTLSSAYEDGYSNVSASFFKLSDYMEDLKNVSGTEKNSEEYVSSYKLILGEKSLFIQRFLGDYEQAKGLYDKNFLLFREIFRDSERESVYQLLKDTLETAKAIAQVLESGRHMYDAIVAASYKQYFVSFVVEKMQPKIESDLSSVFSDITSLEKITETIDDTVEETPNKIKDSKLAFELAKEKLESKKLDLEELQAGPDLLEIRTQKNIVSQKEAALSNAKENLANHFIYAPFDGLVAELNVEPGDSVSSGTVIATLITKQKIAEITLNEVDAVKVRTEQKATIAFDAIDDLSISGEVVEVDAIGSVSQGVVTYKVKIAFDTQDERVKPGMSISTAIITDIKQNALLAPVSAIKQQDNISYVQVASEPAGEINDAVANISETVVAESNLRTQQVEIGLSNDTMTEIISGLNEGDQVVIQTINSDSSQSQTKINSGFGLPVGGSNAVFRSFR